MHREYAKKASRIHCEGYVVDDTGFEPVTFTMSM